MIAPILLFPGGGKRPTFGPAPVAQAQLLHVLTHWLSPMQGRPPQTIREAAARAKAATPAGYAPAVMLPTVYGPWFQAECTTGLGDELLPKDGPDVKRIVDAFHAEGVGCGGWAIPRYLTQAEGQAQGAAARYCDLFALDVEPYAGFLLDASANPANYMRGFQSACDARPWVSLVPQSSGIDVIGHVSDWIRWGQGLRPQCYFTDSPALDWPQPSGGYLAGVLSAAGVSRPIVPIFPRRELDPAHVDRLLAEADGDQDIWVLA